jgi:hypothetical protein
MSDAQAKLLGNAVGLPVELAGFFNVGLLLSVEMHQRKMTSEKETVCWIRACLYLGMCHPLCLLVFVRVHARVVSYLRCSRHDL